jgi:ATP-dependent Clp protease adaptor protein ClpS
MNMHPKGHGFTPPDPFKQGRTSPLVPQPNKYSLPPYRVILLNNVNRDMMFIVRTVMELTRFCRTEALHKMWQAHYNGRAILIVTHKERAELFVELFANRGVAVDLEPG